ncbi:hypothetical protein Efla_003559 [Eimeria flavescens]
MVESTLPAGAAADSAVAESAANHPGQSQADDLETLLKNGRVVDGHVMYRGELKVGRHAAVAVCNEARFSPPVPRDPEVFAEELAGNYDGACLNFKEHEICSKVKVKARMKQNSKSAAPVKATYTATGILTTEFTPEPPPLLLDEAAAEGVCAAYDERLVNFIMVISSLSGNSASYVVEDTRRLLYLRDGQISLSRLLAVRKEVCRSLARLARLRKALAEAEEGSGLSEGSSPDALFELQASLGGALSYRSSDNKHPAVYIQVASLFPTSLYLQVTPAAFQRVLLDVFQRVWGKLAGASRRHAQKISHAAVVLDFGGLSQLDVAAYSTHRLLADIGEVLLAHCPWLLYKVILFKVRFAKDLLWELLRPVLAMGCRIVVAESSEELSREIQADGPFLMHTLGGFNESSVLRCRRPVYNLAGPPQPPGAGDFLRVEELTNFWDEMRKLREEAPEASPEGDPERDPDDEEIILAEHAREHQEEERESAMEKKAQELEEFISRKECLVPHFSKAVKQVLIPQAATGEPFKLTGSAAAAEEATRVPLDLNNVARADVRVCMWKPPGDAAAATRGTAHMLLQLLERRKQWSRPPLPLNYMHAFERTTYSLDCVYHATPHVPMKPQTKPPLELRPVESGANRQATGGPSPAHADKLASFL